MMFFKKKVYYAHSKLIYNTAREKEELRFIKTEFNVVNPNTDMGELGSITPYLKKIDTCYGVVFSYINGFVGKGVYEEVKHSIEVNKPTFLLDKKDFIPIKSIPQIFDSMDWSYRYAKIEKEIL